jgi:hypothetical protein
VASHTLWDRHQFTLWVREVPGGFRARVEDSDGEPVWVSAVIHGSRNAAAEAGRSWVKKTFPLSQRNAAAARKTPDPVQPEEESVQTLLRVLIDAVKANTRTLQQQHQDMMRVWGEP